MSSSGEELAAELAKFELGVSDKEMNETYTNVGFILNIIITSKMNENFYNFLFELKPIVQIDEDMKVIHEEIQQRNGFSTSTQRTFIADHQVLGSGCGRTEERIRGRSQQHSQSGRVHQIPVQTRNNL